MQEQIGEVAGQVWQRLSEQGPMTVNRLRSSLRGSPELIHQAIGWLARENKLNIEQEGRTLKLSLK